MLRDSFPAGGLIVSEVLAKGHNAWEALDQLTCSNRSSVLGPAWLKALIPQHPAWKMRHAQRSPIYNGAMRAVLVHVTDEELARRRSIGLDRWDEMWEGILHMTPAPGLEHQRIADELIMFLGRHLAANGRGTLRSGINVFNDAAAQSDYRIPDLTFVAKGHERMFREDGVHGGPDAVIEIRSPEDESYEKLPFYAALGTREVVVTDRDTKRPEIHRLVGSQFVPQQQDAEGWVHAETMNVRFRAGGQPPVLRIEDLIDPSVHVEI